MDGSAFTTRRGVDVAGWGFCAFCPDGRTVKSLGPVVTDPSDERYLGAAVATNNTAEVTGICKALGWAHFNVPPESVVVLFVDSSWAGNRVVGRWTKPTHEALVQEAAKWLKTARERRIVNLVHVPGHADIEGNEAADELARKALQEQIEDEEPSDPDFDVDLEMLREIEMARDRQDGQHEWDVDPDPDDLPPPDNPFGTPDW